MKKILAGLFAFVLVTGILTVSEQGDRAAATGPFTLTLDCTDADKIRTSLAGSAGVKRLPADASDANAVWVLTGLRYGEPLDVSGADCVVDEGTALFDMNPGFVIDNSGSFTVSGLTGGAVTINVDACVLEGSGVALDPWKVGSFANLVEVGREERATGEVVGGSSCSLSGYYLQTASFDVDTRRVNKFNGSFVSSGSNTLVSPFGVGLSDSVFTGVYDGDHYTINFVSFGAPGGISNADQTDHDRDPIFSEVGQGGVVKKLRMTGRVDTNQTNVASLVRRLAGGTVSEVRSTVHLYSVDSAPRIGGLVSRSEGDDALIQYSSFAGRIDWVPNTGSVRLAAIGGLIGETRPADASTPLRMTIRDSYARPVVAVDLTELRNASSRAFVGGIVGVDGQLASPDRASTLRLVRTYTAGSYTAVCSKDPDPDPDPCTTSRMKVGGFIGYSIGDSATDVFVGNFWLPSNGYPNAVGELQGGAVQPAAYSGGVAVAAPVSAAQLSSLSTFRTKEGETNQPGGPLIGALASTNPTVPQEQDYLWAIEQGNVNTFVAQRREVAASPNDIDISRRGETVDFSREFNRLLWANSTVPSAQYRTRGQLETITRYPSLGRVWEICSEENNDYPVLVWEGRTCGDGVGGNEGGTTTASKTKPVDELAAAIAAGLTGAELQAFLASGLTLEEWLARRLAQTGTPAGALQLALLASGALALMGAWFMVWSNRRRQTI